MWNHAVTWGWDFAFELLLEAKEEMQNQETKKELL